MQKWTSGTASNSKAPAEQRKPITKWKGNLLNEKKTIVNDLPGMGLVSKMHKELKTSIEKII